MFQRVVKYVAIALAMALSVSIFAGVVYGGLELVHMAGLAGNSEPAEMRETELTSEISALTIRLGAGSLTIKEGEKLKVSTDISDMTIEEKDGSLEITENSKFHLFSWRGGQNVVVEAPKDFKFETVKIETGAGKISIEKILANSLKMELGAGEVSIREAGANSIDIDCGVGKVGLGLADEDTAYVFEVKKGLGKITIDGRESEGWLGSTGATKRVKIDGGIGEIEVKTGVVKASKEALETK